MSNKSYALRACVLIALDSFKGQWLTTRWLCKRLGVTSETLTDAALAVIDEGCHDVHRERIDGHVCFGVGCSKDSPVVDIDHQPDELLKAAA